MRILPPIWCVSLLALTAACGSSTSTTTTQDTIGGQDALTDAVSGSDTVGGDTVIGDTIGNDADAADSQPGDTASYLYTTCAAIADCAHTACANSTSASCASACLAGGAPAALPDAATLLTCVETKCIAGQCMGSSDPNCSSNCAGSQCLKELTGCYLAGQTGSKGCWDSIGCISACDGSTDAMNCLLGCIGEMSQPAQQAFEGVAPCLGQDITATAGCEDNMVVCIAPTGTQTCAEALGCAIGCSDAGGGSGNGDPSCAFSCLHNTTSDADKLLLNTMGCDQSNPTCVAAIVQCLAPSGTTSCPDIISCATGCSPGQGQAPDMNCLFTCIQKGTLATGTAAYTELSCMGKSGAGCVDAAVACYKPAGSGSCAQTLSCVQGCSTAGGDVTACQNSCYALASVSGFSDFQTWSGCQQTCSSGCKGDQTCTNTCMTQSCPAAQNACAPT